MTVRPGIIKYGDFICLMAEEGQISFGPAEQTQYLKILITIDQRPPDYVLYQMDIVLDLNEPKEENEFELCRFNLRKGAHLRVYKNFTDMNTEYDTINLIHSS